MYVPDVVPEEDRETMVEEAGYGGSVGIGDSVAVLVVDVTREFVEGKYPNGHPETAKPAARSIRRLMDLARERGIPGLYSRALHGDHPYVRGRWSDSITGTDDEGEGEEMTRLAGELSPSDRDVVFGKHKPSAFFGTQLESMLNAADVDGLVVTGLTTSGCVRATVVDAFSLNYRVTVPEECVADRSRISHEINLFDMDMKYADVRPLEEVLGEL